MPARANTDRDWDARYRTGDTPWDSGLPSRELRRVLEERGLVPCRTLELGCGSGTNAVFLAQRGFRVTAVDCSALALERARQQAADADVSVEWIEGDVQHFGNGQEPFDFVFDRGCYHCCRRVDLRGYLATLRNVTRPGSLLLCLAGNANEQTEGPPRVTEQQLRDELGGLFDVEFLREFRFQDPGGIDGPLGWSCLLIRRAE
jgi:SAM-dependent methyltransferase